MRECHSLHFRFPFYLFFFFGQLCEHECAFIHFSTRIDRYSLLYRNVYILSCLIGLDEGRLKIKWPILLSHRFVFSLLHFFWVFFLLLLLLIRVFLFYFQPKSKGERSHFTKIWYHYFESTKWRWIIHRKHGINNRTASRIDCTFYFLNAKHAIQLRQLARCLRCFSWYIRLMLYLIAFFNTFFFLSFYFPYLVKHFVHSRHFSFKHAFRSFLFSSSH